MLLMLVDIGTPFPFGAVDGASPEQISATAALALTLLWASVLVFFVTLRSMTAHNLSAADYHRALAVPRGIFAVYGAVLVIVLVSDSSLPDDLAAAFAGVVSVVAIYELAKEGTPDALAAIKQS